MESVSILPLTIYMSSQSTFANTNSLQVSLFRKGKFSWSCTKVFVEPAFSEVCSLQLVRTFDNVGQLFQS